MGSRLYTIVSDSVPLDSWLCPSTRSFPSQLRDLRSNKRVHTLSKERRT